MIHLGMNINGTYVTTLKKNHKFMQLLSYLHANKMNGSKVGERK